MSIRVVTVFCFAALILATDLRAETAYVVDEFEITMRSGKTTSHQIKDFELKRFERHLKFWSLLTLG